MFYIELILIGICLSLDAFSLAVSISLNYINKSKINPKNHLLNHALILELKNHRMSHKQPLFY